MLNGWLAYRYYDIQAERCEWLFKSPLAEGGTYYASWRPHYRLLCLYASTLVKRERSHYVYRVFLLKMMNYVTVFCLRFIDIARWISVKSCFSRGRIALSYADHPIIPRWSWKNKLVKTSCRRVATTICPAPLFPPWGLKRLAPPSRRQRSSSFPRPKRSHAHRCSRLTRQHGGDQSGLVTLTFDLLTLKEVSESHVTLATSVPILVFLGLSVLDLGPMYATDRQTSDSIIIPPLLGAGA